MNEKRDQSFNADGDLNVNNYYGPQDMNREQTKEKPWLFVLVVMIVFMQILQGIGLVIMFFYIHSIEGRIENSVRESGKEVIRYIKESD